MVEKLTIVDVCNKYRISRGTLMQWRKKGIITAIKVSRKKILFDKEVLEGELGLTTNNKTT